MLAAKIRMRPGISIESAVASINALERRIKERFPEVALGALSSLISRIELAFQ